MPLPVSPGTLGCSTSGFAPRSLVLVRGRTGVDPSGAMSTRWCCSLGQRLVGLRPTPAWVGAVDFHGPSAHGCRCSL
eukprot:120447-Alexandrium_andersonii.AAC.1